MDLKEIHPLQFGVTMIVVLVALTVHEFAHAKFADMAGDPTPRQMGRVTLNPLKHLSPIGTLMLLISSVAGIGIGWGKPVIVNPTKMHNPRWDHFASVAAGPVSNLLQAIVFAVAMRVLFAQGVVSEAAVADVLHMRSNSPLDIFLTMGVLVNVSLFLFNLIPLGPLDGHWLVGTFLPTEARMAWYRFNQGIGSMVFLALVLIPSNSEFDLLGKIFFPGVIWLARMLFGPLV